MRIAFLCLISAAFATAEIHHNPGSTVALPHEKYIHVVSEADSPVQQTYIKSKDGLYIAAAIRKPKGGGRNPAIIMFHGAPGGRGMEQLVGWSRGDWGGPVWERFLQEGYVVAVADYRGGNMNLTSAPSTTGMITSIDDGLAVIDYINVLGHHAARVVFAVWPDRSCFKPKFAPEGCFRNVCSCLRSLRAFCVFARHYLAYSPICAAIGWFRSRNSAPLN